jgi:hypothetical protein
LATLAPALAAKAFANNRLKIAACNAALSQVATHQQARHGRS